MPQVQCGFAADPGAQDVLSPTWSGSRSSSHHTAVSLFAGCGGLDLGFAGGFRYLGQRYEPLPFDIVAAIDNSEDAIKTYRLNLGHHARVADLTTLDVNDIARADVLLGGFPCQDFSSSGPKSGLAGKRGQLYTVLVDYMSAHQPKVVIGENVPHLSRLEGGIYLKTILADLEAVGYKFEVWDLYGPDYGLPQSRRRLFLVGIRNDLDGFPSKPRPTHAAGHVSVDAAICDLETVGDESVPNQSQFYVATRATAGGGQGDHTNQRGTVAYCIRANARGRIQFHYSLPRRLTVRECARLQAFPDSFVFPFSTQRNLTLIGNAVPPLLGFWVGSSIREFLEMTTARQSDADDAAKNNLVPPLYSRTSREQLKLFDRAN